MIKKCKEKAGKLMFIPGPHTAPVLVTTGAWEAAWNSTFKRAANPNSLNPDPDPLNADPAFQVNLDQGFWWPKTEKNSRKLFIIFFLTKNWNLLTCTVCPSYRRSPPKRTYSDTALKKMKFINFFLCLRVIFALLDPDPDCESGYGSRDPTKYESYTDPQHCI